MTSTSSTLASDSSAAAISSSTPSPLDSGRRDQQRNPREAAPAHLDDVANRGPGRRGHDSDAARKVGNRPLGELVEEPLVLEPRAQLLEGELQRALAAGLQRPHDQLEVAPLGVEADARFDHHLEPLFGVEGQSRSGASEQDGAQLGAVVGQGEVAVARAGPEQVLDLARDEDPSDLFLQQLAKPAGKLGNAENSRTCARKLELTHSVTGSRPERPLGERRLTARGRGPPARRRRPAQPAPARRAPRLRRARGAAGRSTSSS